MNTLFEKFKAYELTAEQAEKVRGGGEKECRESISDEDVNYLASLNPGMNTGRAYDILMMACMNAATAERIESDE